MTATAGSPDLLGYFADLFDYPGGELQQTAASCGDLLRDLNPPAESSLSGFRSFLQSHDPGRVEEIFTATFDLQPACFPYVGYQLCGEGQQRALFLMELQQLYRRHGFDPGVELPDHLSTVLRFLEVLDDVGCRNELVADGLIPALDKILQGLDAETQPYACLVRALRIYLAGTLGDQTDLSRPDSLDANRRKEICS